jgi:hypothetical protein
MEELEALVKGMNRDDDEPDYNDENEGDEDDDAEETPEPPKRNRKSVTSPKANSETTNGGEPCVHNPNSLDKRSGGGAAPVRKSLEDVVTEETSDAIEVSSVLGEMTKGINALANLNSAEVAQVRREVARLSKSVDAIGTAVVKGLTLQVNTAKSLKEDVEAIGAQPVGRKGVAKSIERSFAGNEQDTAPALPSANEVMVKSLKAVKGGTISAQQASMLETARQQGKWAEVSALWNRVVESV